MTETPAPTAAPGARAPSARGGIIDTEEAAARLARVIISDIELYNAKKIAAGLDLASEIAEGRALFKSRVSGELLASFETALANKPASASANARCRPRPYPGPSLRSSKRRRPRWQHCRQPPRLRGPQPLRPHGPRCRRSTRRRRPNRAQAWRRPRAPPPRLTRSAISRRRGIRSLLRRGRPRHPLPSRIAALPVTCRRRPVGSRRRAARPTCRKRKTRTTCPRRCRARTTTSPRSRSPSRRPLRRA